MSSRFLDLLTKDTWVAPRRVTGLLLLLTLLYLAVESAFNARLVNVLGALSIEQAHKEAISGLEYWGRVLSSAALGLALLSAYVAQSQKKLAPQPLRLFARLAGRQMPRATWRFRDWSIAAGVVVLAMLGLFHGERWWVENRAENVDADSRWWMFYAVRAVDALLISADQLEAFIRKDAEPAKPAEASASANPPAQPVDAQESKLITETSKFPSFHDEYLLEPANFSRNQFESADWRVAIAIAPHALQNFAKTQRQSESQEEPLTPREIQKRIEEGLSNNAEELAEPLVNTAAFGPVRQCLDVIYDRSVFRTRPMSFDPDLCVTHAASLEQLKSSHPELWAALPEQCVTMEGARRQFADFAMFRCTLTENDARFREIARSAAEAYLAAFERERAQIIATYKADPRTLPAPIAAKIVADLDGQLARNAELRGSVTFEDVAIGSRERLPPCGELGGQLLTRFHLARKSDDEVAETRLTEWLGVLDKSYCTALDTLIADAPGHSDISLLASRLDAIRDAAQLGLDVSLEGAGIERRILLPPDWKAPSAAEYAEWIRAQLIIPLKRSMFEILGEQLNASPAERSQLPDPATVSRREEFEDNLIVSKLFKQQLQNLTDGAFGCLGLTDLSGRLKVNDDLSQLMSPEGNAAFNKRAGNLLFENIFRTRLSGTINDFELSGRCGPAGVAAYHRGYIPGFALLISLLGLIYHSRKAVLYVLRFIRMSTFLRHVIAILVVVVLLAWPLMENVKALRVRETDIVVQRYARSHGPATEFGVRWVVKAQALYHPWTDTLYRNVFRRLRINFTRDIGPAEIDLQKALIDQSCGRVPQIRQTAQYQVLRSVITHRDLCRSNDRPQNSLVAGK